MKVRRVSERAKRALRTFAWQSLGFAVVFGLLAIGIYRVEDTRQQGNQATERIEVIEHVEPIDLLRKCLRTPKCRRLFLHPEQLQTERRGVQVDARQPDAGRNVSLPSPTDQPAAGAGEGREPRGPGSDRGRPPRNPGNPAAPQPQVPPAAPPVASSPSTVPAPERAPGNSGETPAPEKAQGVQACVDLVVSACMGVPPLLP